METIDQALVRLRKNPGYPVRARVDDIEVEISVVDRSSRPERLGERMAALGPWSGETEAELVELISEARRNGGSAEPHPL
jgi:hypothetical protein